MSLMVLSPTSVVVGGVFIVVVVVLSCLVGVAAVVPGLAPGLVTNILGSLISTRSRIFSSSSSTSEGDVDAGNGLLSELPIENTRESISISASSTLFPSSSGGSSVTPCPKMLSPFSMSSLLAADRGDLNARETAFP